MNTKGFRRMLFGEKMPDKNDPQYKERYERDVNAGRKFAQATRLDKLAAKIQGFANRNKILFLVMVFGFVIGTFTFNIYRLTKAYRHGQEIKVPQKCRTACSENATRSRLLPLLNPPKPDNDEKDIRENQFQAAQIYASCHIVYSAVGRVLFHL
mgnify:CR=1 FL=1